jgi:hypothetical protein
MTSKVKARALIETEYNGNKLLQVQAEMRQIKEVNDIMKAK